MTSALRSSKRTPSTSSDLEFRCLACDAPLPTMLARAASLRCLACRYAGAPLNALLVARRVPLSR
jgi:hypothetical protein